MSDRVQDLNQESIEGLNIERKRGQRGDLKEKGQEEIMRIPIIDLREVLGSQTRRKDLK